MSSLQYEPSKHSKEVSNPDNKRKIGSLAGEKYLVDGYDFDESNAEIAEMFGVDDMSCVHGNEDIADKVT